MGASVIEKNKLDIARAVKNEIGHGVNLIVEQLALDPTKKERLFAAVVIKTFIDEISDEDLEEIIQCMYKY